jgi:CheY-like chemotaxis protein
VNDILDFSKLEAGEVRVINEPFKLDEVLNKLVDLYSVVTHSKSIILQLNVHPDVYIDLVGDALRIGQVLGNIVSNAIKFTKAGSVSIDVSFVGASHSACTLRFSISDTGIGLSDEQIENVFKPFRQADMSTTREYGGSGLGLSISQRLLRMMGSQIEVKSSKGQGAEFFFEVEFALQPNAKRYADLVAHKKRALVVIEDTTVNCTVGEYFEQWGVKFVSYSRLSLAAESFDKDSQAFDNLVIHLADDGEYEEVVEVCRRWRKINPNAQNILIVITTQDYIDDPTLLKLHATIIVQPPTPSRLFDAINSNGLKSLQASDMNLVQQSRELTKNIVGARVLLAEDVETNQVVAVDLLETLGLQVDVVSNGSQAVEAVRSNHYEVVLMDFHMPVLNGLEATKKIRELKGYESLPIVAMTAAVFEQDKQAAIDSGMNAHLAKPIQIYQLASVLKEFIPEKEYPKGSLAEPNTSPASSSGMDLSVLHDEIDIAAVKLNFGHNQMVYQNCLRHFSNDFADWALRIGRELEQKNYDNAAQLAHKLKGAAGNIYATAIYSQSSKLQQALNLGHQGPLKKLKAQLHTLLNKINAVLNEQDAIVSKKPAAVNGSKKSEFIDCLEQVKALVMKSRFVEPALLSQFVENALWIDSTSVEQFKQAVETFNFPQAKLLLDKVELAWKIKEERV